MSQPPTYSRAYNFSDYQATNPSTPVPGNKLDDEFSRIKAVLDAIRANLALIQRDDTAVANESIGYDQLKAELDGFGFNPPEEWTTATNYVVRDTVFHDSSFYRCLVSHTSGTFATDLAAAKWALIADFTQATADAQTAQAAAAAAQAAAEAAQAAAATSATNAATSATNAATSATNAATSATNAAASAATAATLIGGTVTEAVRHDVAQGLNSTQKAQARSNIGIDAVPDDGLVIVDPADGTKKARLDAGGVTAGQTRVLAVPDYDGTIATRAGTETLTNKTLTTPTLTLKQSTSPTPTAEGDIQWDTDDNAIVVGDGSGQKTFRANAWELITTGTPSAVASYAVTGLSAYRLIRITGHLSPSGDGDTLFLRTSTNNGSSYDSGASDYDFQTSIGSSATYVGSRSTAAANFNISVAGVGNDTGEAVEFEFILSEFNKAAYCYGMGKLTFVNSSGVVFGGTMHGRRLQATARDAFQLSFSGNIASGYVVVEGIRG